MNYWLVVGTTQNWDTAFEQGNIWGLRQTQRHLWESLNENDKVLFYATYPVSGLIGYGVIRTKFKQNKPLWPDERKQHKVIWPLRFEFDVDSCLPREEWKTEKLISKDISPRAGFQLLNEDIAVMLVSSLSGVQYAPVEEEPLTIHDKSVEYAGATEEIQKTPLSHDDIKDILVQIGKIQGYIAESEYSFSLGKLDVVWRRVIKSVPTYVFEIQVGGDIYHALAKLKDAFDLWNSHIFIVASEKERSKVYNLIGGAFHEIEPRINFIELGQVQELYKRKKNYLAFEKELGIR